MPKIPWTPPKRPPRIKVDPDPIEEFAPVNEQDRCETCVGMGLLYKKWPDGAVEDFLCGVCKGTGVKPDSAPMPPESPVSGACINNTCPDNYGGRHKHGPMGNVTWIRH